MTQYKAPQLLTVMSPTVPGRLKCTTNPPLLPFSPTSIHSPDSSYLDSPRESTHDSQALAPADTVAIKYPLIPVLTAQELFYFHKGAQIALENILDDYLRNSDMSVFEVIADLEDKRPIVGIVKEDWERRCVIEGARWLGQVVGRWWAELVEDESQRDAEKGSEDENEDRVMDASEGVVDATVDDTLAGEELGEVHRMHVEEGDHGFQMAVKPTDRLSKHGFDGGDVEHPTTQGHNEGVREVPNGTYETGGSRKESVPGMKLSQVHNAGIDELNIPLLGDEIMSDSEQEEDRDKREACIMVHMVKVLGRWLDLQVEHVLKSE